MSNRGGLSYFDERVNQRKVDFLQRHLAPGSCLDLGCGSGLYGPVMQARCPELLQADLLDRRLPAVQHLPFRALDARAWDLADSFDNIVLFDVLEHLPDQEAFLDRLRRHCRRRLILSVPNRDDARLRALHLTYGHHTDKTHCREYSPDDLHTVLRAHGFRVDVVEPHINVRIADIAEALSDPPWWSRAAGRSATLYLKVLLRLGLLHNTCAADWFCAATPE